MYFDSSPFAYSCKEGKSHNNFKFGIKKKRKKKSDGAASMAAKGLKDQAAFSDQIFGIKNNCSTISRNNFRTKKKKKEEKVFWSLFSLELRKLVPSRLNFGLVTLQTVTVY